MNKKYQISIKLVFLIFIILIIVGIIMGKEGLSKAVASETKPIRTIDSPLTISGNQFWSADYDYKISSEITIQASSSLNIENGSRISIIGNGSFLIEGGVLNIGSVSSTSSVNNVVDFFSLINSSGNLINLATADEVFASSVYKSSNILNTKIEISGAGYNEIFGVYNGGIINARKLDIENTLSEGVYNDLGRSLFGLYNASQVNLFETNINNIKVPGSKAFFADNNSRIVLYRSNINGFIGWNFANISRSTVLNILRTKMNDVKTDGAINIFTKSVLNFKESFISATPLDESGYNSGTCISAFKDTTVDIVNSDIGPCFVAFYFSGIGNFKVNQNNLVGNSLVVSNFSPSVDLKNNWWGRVDGPRPVDFSTLDPDGNYSTIEYRAAIKNQNAVRDFSNGVVSSPFATVPFKDASPCCSSVLFIPGIQASRLYKKSSLGIENQLWEPNRNKDVESLFLNSIGVSVDSNIYTKDIILKTNFFGPIGPIDIYQSLINLLAKEKTDGNINDFQTLAYDWRLLPSNILSSGIKTDSYTVMLKDKIKDMAKKSPSGKVIIIAHSYGGLLAKSLLEDLEKEGDEDLIESVSLVSVPEYGTPQSIPSIFYGDNQDLLGGLILSKTTAMGLGRNMLSAHLLLPSSLYFSNSDSVYNQKNLISFDNWVASRLASGGEVIDSQGEMIDFLKNKNIISKNFNVNSFVFDKATAEHDLIDNYSSNLSSKTYSILAVGIPTLSGLTYVRPRCRGLFYCSPTSISSPDFTRKYSLMGDGVVIAHNLATRSGSVFTVDIGKENEVKKTASMFFREDPIAHKDVFRSSGVKDILHAILSRSKQESQSINSFSVLVNPYVSYVSGPLSKPGPILGSYGDSSVISGVLPGIPKIKDDATDSDFVERFNNSKVLVAEAYGPVVLKTNYQSIADLQNKPFDQLNLENRIVNYTNYSDGNRVGVVSVAPGVSGGGGSGSGGGNTNFGGLSGTNIFAQGSGVGIAQIVTKIDDTEIIYPNISVTPSTDIDINYSTTTIYVDNNSDGTIDKRIVPIQINVGTSTGTSTDVANLSTSSDPIGELFDIAKARIRAYVSGGNVGSGVVGGSGGIGGALASSSSFQSTSSTPLATSSSLFATSSTLIGTSSVYLANKYIEKLDIAQRKYQKLGVLQSLTLLKSFYGSMESNMNTISNLILMYNKQQGFYSMNNFLSNNKKVLFLTGRQQEMREEILVYIEIHDAFSALTQGLGRGL